MNKSKLFFPLLMLVSVLAFTGCASNECRFVYSKPVPTDASPVYKWTGENSDIHTKWRDEYVRVEVTAYVPDDWEKPGDAFWTVESATYDTKMTYEQGETGADAPFVGVCVTYKNQNGTDLTKIVPAIDFSLLGSRNFVFIEPNIEKKDGRIVRIAPVAYLGEATDGRQTIWYKAKVQLFPKQDSELTPAPEPTPEEPDGTPIVSY